MFVTLKWKNGETERIEIKEPLPETLTQEKLKLEAVEPGGKYPSSSEDIAIFVLRGYGTYEEV